MIVVIIIIKLIIDRNYLWPTPPRMSPALTVGPCSRQAPLKEAGMPVFLIGGAEKAAELDAKRAIDQGTRLAAVVEDAKTGDVYNAPESLKAKVRHNPPPPTIYGFIFGFTRVGVLL